VRYQRTIEWSRRQAHPTTAQAPLGWGAEYWDRKAENYDGHLALKNRRRALGRKSRKREIANDLAYFLLSDVIVAAGGVELAVERLAIAHEQLVTLAVRHGIRGTADYRHGLADLSSIDAAYAFSDLLAWVRTVNERLDRKSWDKGVRRRQGLLPSIRPKRLHARVEKLVTGLRASSFGDCLTLANFTLHTALTREPRSGVEVDQTGRVILPIPDTPTSSVAHWYLLTWDDDRDGFEFADAVWEDLRRFMDELLAAFERAVPKRLRR
jgi:hypothetical protein